MDSYTIPPFALKYNTKNEEQDKKIHSSLVRENFLRIEREVNELLEPFRAVEES
jgi:hypothetical protein